MPLAIGAGFPCLGFIFASLSKSFSIFRCSCGCGRLGFVIFLLSHIDGAKKGSWLSRAKHSDENREPFYAEDGEMQDEELCNCLQPNNPGCDAVSNSTSLQHSGSSFSTRLTRLLTA